MRNYRSFTLLFLVIFLTSCSGVRNITLSKKHKPYDSYRGLVMAGYQGWFNAEGDGAERGFYHYSGKYGFQPGSASVDMWPDVTEYDKTYPTSFTMTDGVVARVFSSEDYSTVDTHFRWMKEYGLDGVFMQRFVSEIKNKSGKRHFDKVLNHAMTAAYKYERAIAVMYDLSGCDSDDCKLILEDIDTIALRYNLFNHDLNPSYLYHNGHPLVSVWGVGFNDKRSYSLDDTYRIVTTLIEKGFSIMLGVPTNWRTLSGDTESNSMLHDLIRKCDIIMPWFVGRYDEEEYDKFKSNIYSDIEWCRASNVDYVPLVYPGFSWRNMYGEDTFNVPRNSGRFFQKQLDGAIDAGAKMIYVAMFDEIDEGTAIFKCAKQVPRTERGTRFVPIDADIDNDYFLKAVGKTSETLKERKN